MMYIIVEENSGKLLSKESGALLTDKLEEACVYKQKAAALRNATMYNAFAKVNHYVVRDEEGRDVE